MKRWFFLIFMFYMITFLGCSSFQSPANPDLERKSQSLMNDYTFITGKTSATSWGDVYLNANKTGYGNLPVRCGAYVYFIQYLSDAVPPSTPPKTVPVKYEVATGVVTQLGAVSTGYFDLWNKIDATNNGTLMIGKFGVTTIKKAGRTINLTYVTNAELSDDGNWVFYIQNDKAYRMNLTSMQKTLICSLLYCGEVATNADGSKAVLTVSVNGVYNLYLWNGSGLTTIGTGYAYYMGVDMSPDGVASYSVNGKCYYWNGAHQLVGTGVFPAVDDGIMLYGNNGNLMSYDIANATGATVGSYATAVQQVAWSR